ncbi:hypothetical protein Bbad01_37330 [Bacillus badius]|nr:hypothetical protein Bbad01_37330 [Bacillus badius]
MPFNKKIGGVKSFLKLSMSTIGNKAMNSVMMVQETIRAYCFFSLSLSKNLKTVELLSIV